MESNALSTISAPWRNTWSSLDTSDFSNKTTSAIFVRSLLSPRITLSSTWRVAIIGMRNFRIGTVSVVWFAQLNSATYLSAPSSLKRRLGFKSILIVQMEITKEDPIIEMDQVVGKELERSRLKSHTDMKWCNTMTLRKSQHYSKSAIELSLTA